MSSSDPFSTGSVSLGVGVVFLEDEYVETGFGNRSDDFGSLKYLSGPIGLALIFPDNQIHYAWVLCSQPVNIGNSAFDIHMVSYAYETQPNTPIAAGAVPEPSMFWLLSLPALIGLLKRRVRVR